GPTQPTGGGALASMAGGGSVPELDPVAPELLLLDTPPELLPPALPELPGWPPRPPELPLPPEPPSGDPSTTRPAPPADSQAPERTIAQRAAMTEIFMPDRRASTGPKCPWGICLRF